MPTFTPGDCIGPHYLVESVLGEGGMAVVYRCWHRGQEEVLAVKVLNEELSRVEDARARFMQEAATQARLEHPGIVEVVDFTAQGLLVAYAMPCAAGFDGDVSLGARLDRGPLDLGTALDWFEQLAAALEHAHAAGVIHRDVKPSNVLLDTGADGRAVLRLMDFGVAKLLSGPARTRTGSTLGTLEYMAPEQIQDPRRVGPASDQYAAACVLYEMLCGRRPFERGEGETDYSFMHRVVSQGVDERPLAGLPVGVQAVLRRGLAKDPGERFSGLGELAAMLRLVVVEQMQAPVALVDSFAPDAGPDPDPGRDQQPLPPYVVVRADGFVMGSPPEERGRQGDETCHHVRLTRSFAMASTPVTQAQWEALMGNNPSWFQEASRPVENVSWYDAVAYCNALSRASGLREAYVLSGVQGTPGKDGYQAEVHFVGLNSPGYRLPTEAEWEYACRGDAPGPRPGDLGASAWWSDGSGWGTRPVGAKQANAWGLHGMLGNVWEWCWDWYGAYPTASVSDPVGPSHGTYRVRRGGSWNDPAAYVRAACRLSLAADMRCDTVSFRPCRSIL